MAIPREALNRFYDTVAENKQYGVPKHSVLQAANVTRDQWLSLQPGYTGNQATTTPTTPTTPKTTNIDGATDVYNSAIDGSLYDSAAAGLRNARARQEMQQRGLVAQQIHQAGFAGQPVGQMLAGGAEQQIMRNRFDDEIGIENARNEARFNAAQNAPAYEANRFQLAETKRNQSLANIATAYSNNTAWQDVAPNLYNEDGKVNKAVYNKLASDPAFQQVMQARWEEEGMSGSFTPEFAANKITEAYQQSDPRAIAERHIKTLSPEGWNNMTPEMKSKAVDDLLSLNLEASGFKFDWVQMYRDENGELTQDATREVTDKDGNVTTQNNTPAGRAFQVVKTDTATGANAGGGTGAGGAGLGGSAGGGTGSGGAYNNFANQDYQQQQLRVNNARTTINTYYGDEGVFDFEKAKASLTSNDIPADARADILVEMFKSNQYDATLVLKNIPTDALVEILNAGNDALSKVAYKVLPWDGNPGINTVVKKADNEVIRAMMFGANTLWGQADSSDKISKILDRMESNQKDEFYKWLGEDDLRKVLASSGYSDDSKNKIWTDAGKSGSWNDVVDS